MCAAFVAARERERERERKKDREKENVLQCVAVQILNPVSSRV